MAVIVIPVALAMGWRPGDDGVDPAGARGDQATATDDAAPTAGDDGARTEDGTDTTDSDQTTAAAPSSTTTVPRAPLAADLQADAADDGTATVQLHLVDPLGLSRAASDVELKLDLATGEVCYSVATVGIRAPYPAAIHQGVSGQSGPVVVDLGQLPAEDFGCVSTEPVLLQQVIDDPISHYLSFDDPNLGSSLRSQMASSAVAEGELMLDPDGGGATVVISESAVTLTGVVPSFETEQWFVGLFSDAMLPELELVNELRIVPQVPRPSGRIFLQDGVLFDTGSSQLTDPPPRAVRQLAAVLAAHPAWSANVVGHTDDSGSEDTNRELSLRRAEAVRDALVVAGVDATTLTVEGAGSSQPVADNTTPEGRAENRRIELEITPTM